MLDARGDRLEEALHQRELRLAHHVPQRVEVLVVRALEAVDLLLVLEHRERRRRVALEPVLLGEARVHRLHHVVDLGAAPPGARRNRARIVAKNSFIAPRTPLVKGLPSIWRRVRARVGAQRIEADHVEELVRLLREHGAQRGEPLQAALEELLLLAHALHHVLDDVLVLAAQRAELGQPARRCRAAARRAARARRRERLHLGLRRRADDVALRRE